MGDHATREEMLKAFGPLAAAFEPLGDDRTPYLSLLNLQFEGVTDVLRLIRQASASHDAEPYVLTLLSDVNWRPHLVGAIATYFVRSKATIAQTWRAIDAGSWVTPQLSATLSLVDDAFVPNALGRLSKRCPVNEDLDDAFDCPAARHSAQGPAGVYHRSCKTAASLLALLQSDLPEDDHVRSLDSDSGLQDLVADDFDDSGGIAVSWRVRLLELVNQL